MHVRAAVIALTLVIATRSAAAADGDPIISSARTPILVTDLVGGSLFVGAIATKSTVARYAMAYTGLALYLVAPPIAHGIAGDGLAQKTFGWRLLLPVGGALVGGALGVQIEDDNCGDCSIAMLGAGIGILAGGILAGALDYYASSDLAPDEPAPMTFTLGGSF